MDKYLAEIGRFDLTYKMQNIPQEHRSALKDHKMELIQVDRPPMIRGWAMSASR